jgi:hypothetical protein
VPVLARRLVLIIPRDTKYASVCLPSADVLSGKVQLDWHGSTYPLGFLDPRLHVRFTCGTKCRPEGLRSSLHLIEVLVGPFLGLFPIQSEIQERKSLAVSALWRSVPGKYLATDA